MSKIFTAPDAIKMLAISASAVWPAASLVPSPCSSVCRMDGASGWCEGCFRTLDEIVQWSHNSEVGKRAVWALIGQRVEQAHPGVASFTTLTPDL